MSTDLIKHGFSLGRVHVLEEQMLSGDDFERLLEANDIASVLHILEETDYDIFVEKIKDEADIEDGLEKFLISFYKLLDELEEPSISRFFRMSHDFDNLRALLTDLKGYRLSKLGMVEPSMLRIAVEEKNYSALAKYFGIEENKFQDLEEYELFEIDRYLQKKMYDIKSDLARKRRLSLMQEIVELEIDTENIKTWLRKSNAIAEELLDGGRIKKDKFLSDRASEAIADFCKPLAIPLIENMGISDKNLQDCMVLLLKRYRYDTVSANRLITFIKAKELEVKNIRIILFSSLNELSREKIESDLRYLYV